jgi:hypothetical protein
MGEKKIVFGFFFTDSVGFFDILSLKTHIFVIYSRKKRPLHLNAGELREKRGRNAGGTREERGRNAGETREKRGRNAGGTREKCKISREESL